MISTNKEKEIKKEERIFNVVKKQTPFPKNRPKKLDNKYPNNGKKIAKTTMSKFVFFISKNFLKQKLC